MAGLRDAIAEDAALFREGLTRLIESCGPGVPPRSLTVAPGSMPWPSMTRIVVAGVRMLPVDADEGL